MTNHEIAVIGGTGAQGKGLAYRFARHGRSVVIGSRSAERAAATAESILARLDAHIPEIRMPERILYRLFTWMSTAVSGSS